MNVSIELQRDVNNGLTWKITGHIGDYVEEGREPDTPLQLANAIVDIDNVLNDYRNSQE